MKAICSYSAIPFEIQYFPFTLSSSKEKDESMYHPAFSLSTKRLTGLIPRYLDGSLSSTDTRLLFLSLLHSTGLVTFKTAAIPEDSIIEKNILSLASLATFIYTQDDVHSIFPSFIITRENASLEHISSLLKTWSETKDAINAGLRRIGEERESNRERAMERLARASSKDLTTYAKRLADWADKAASFPTFLVSREDALGGIETIPCNLLWKEIIITCGEKNLNVWKINKGDLQDILDHLEDNLELGTLYSNALFKLLERTIDKQDNFLGIDLSAPYEILSGAPSENATAAQKIEDNAILSMIEDAPKTEPVRADYVSYVSYLRDLGKWKTAQKFLSSHPANTSQDGDSL